MTLARRELLAKCMALGVVTSSANLLPAALAAAWQEKEKPRQGEIAGGHATKAIRYGMTEAFQSR